jgi:large subunit ribosomal protein L3
MTSVWDKWGKCIPLTVLHLDRNQVIDWKTKEKDGYCAMQIGCGAKGLSNLKKPQIGHYLKNNLPPKSYLKEFKMTADNYLPIGYMIGVRHFTPGRQQ